MGFLSEFRNLGFLSPGILSLGILSVGILSAGFLSCGVFVGNPQISIASCRHNRDLKQARTATAVNKQLNFTVGNKPHTTNYIYCIF